MSRTRVLVADSLSIFRAGVRNLLARKSGFDVLEAETTDEVVRVAVEERAEIALIDLHLPPRGGLEAVRRLHQGGRTYPILWSFDPTREAVLNGIRAGAFGFLRKDISPDGLVQALRGVAQGEAPISRDLVSLMIDALHELDQQNAARERLASLSSRELEVLELVSGGARNRQIAAALTISEFTVKRHVQNILEKLEVASRRAAGECYLAAFGPDLRAQVLTRFA